MSTHQQIEKNHSTTSTRANKSKSQTAPHPAQILQRLEDAPASIRPTDVLQLQRTIGNRATGQLLQTKLKLGPAGDRHEQEAEQVAQQVVHANRQPDVQREEMGDGLIQAKPLAGRIRQVRRAYLATAEVQRTETEDELQAAPNHGMEGGDVEASVARSIQSAKGSGQPLHDGVRSSMERGFGADFGGVRVHTGGQADTLNRSLNARAFTIGKDIFFGKGEYNPGSPAGKELLAHELTHTVQQGAIQLQLQTAVQVPSEAPSAEQTTQNVMGHAASPSAQPQADGTADIQCVGRQVEVGQNMPAPAVQRNVGMELETQPDWGVTTNSKKKQRAVAKGTPIIHRPYFQLQAEYSSDVTSNLEFVTNPPGVKNRGEYDKFRNEILKLRGDLNERTGKEAFPADELAGGENAYLIHPGSGQIAPHLQVTAGVPLASVEALMKNLSKIGAQGNVNYTSSANKGRQVATEFAQKVDLGGGPSQSLIGFVTLIQRYLAEGMGDPYAKTQQVATFPKAVFSVMARTDFKQMFSMLPEEERNVIAGNMELWVSTMLSKNVVNQEYRSEGPVLNQVFDDPQSEASALRIGTSRQDWLTQMPERDLLTYKGKQDTPSDLTEEASEDERLREKASKGRKDVQSLSGKRTSKNTGFNDYKVSENQPDVVEMDTEALNEMVASLEDIYQGMGALGKTVDYVQYSDQETPTKAIIVEIRRPPEVSPDNWAGAMDSVYNAVDDAIRYPQGKTFQEQQTKTSQGFFGFGKKTTTKTITKQHDAKDYEGELSEKQQELREHANKLRNAVRKLNSKNSRSSRKLVRQKRIPISGYK